MTAPLSAEPYRAKVWKNKRGETYFALVYCPASDLEFHLLWPVALLTYPTKKTVYPKCPGCKHSFTPLDLPTGKVLFIAAAGCEHFPAAAASSWSVISVCRSGNATTPKETSNCRKQLQPADKNGAVRLNPGGPILHLEAFFRHVLFVLNPSSQ
jgi:ribosomal protein L40E